jgi:hypothetical protein
MAAPARTPITDLPAGHEFPPTTFALSDEDVSRYLDAVGDANAVYRQHGLVPPLAVAASAIGALLDALELPADTLHTGQELEMHGGVAIGATLALRGRIAQRSERGGHVISVIEFEVRPDGVDAASLSGRTTVLVAGGAS